MPRPSEGFVHAAASATRATPVATGRPSATMRRQRSAMPLIATTSPIGSPCTQWAWSGSDSMTAPHRSLWRSCFTGWSPVDP